MLCNEMGFVRSQDTTAVDPGSRGFAPWPGIRLISSSKAFGVLRGPECASTVLIFKICAYSGTKNSGKALSENRKILESPA